MRLLGKSGFFFLRELIQAQLRRFLQLHAEFHNLANDVFHVIIRVRRNIIAVLRVHVHEVSVLLFHFLHAHHAAIVFRRDGVGFNLGFQFGNARVGRFQLRGEVFFLGKRASGKRHQRGDRECENAFDLMHRCNPLFGFTSV